jgi:type II secretory pathway pseudopilin PulG
MFKQLLKSQKGFSIVQVLIAAGMMGGLALVLTKLSENQMQVQKGATEATEINEITSRLQRYFLDSDACKNSLAGKTINNNSKINLSELKDRYNKSFIYSTSGKNQITPNLLVKKIEANRADNVIKVEVTFEKVSKKGFGGKEIKKSFDLDGAFSGNTITGCYSQMDNAVKSACTSLGGTISGTTCTNTVLHQEICATKLEIKKLTGDTTAIPGCPKKLALTTVKDLRTSGSSYTLPANYQADTLKVYLLGGGGGGGCGGGKRGDGGASGGVNTVVAPSAVKAGNNLTYSIGARGNRSSTCNNGGAGGSTIVNLAGQSFAAAGGSGGSNRCGNYGSCGGCARCGNGGNISSFAGVSSYSWYGGTFSNNSSGADGQGYGTGGAGGEKTDVDKRNGGHGKPGAIVFEYKTWSIVDA